MADASYRAWAANNDAHQGVGDPLDVTQQGTRTAALKNQSAIRVPIDSAVSVLQKLDSIAETLRHEGERPRNDFKRRRTAHCPQDPKPLASGRPGKSRLDRRAWQSE